MKTKDKVQQAVLLLDINLFLAKKKLINIKTESARNSHYVLV